MSICFKSVSIGLSFLFFGFPLTAESQNVLTTDSSKNIIKPLILPKIKKPKPISKDLSGGLRFNTDGWSVFIEKGYVKDGGYEREPDKFHDDRIFTVEFIGHKHPREIRQRPFDQSGSGGKKYAFGKVNSFYALKLGYGFRTLLAGKPELGTVSIHWVNSGGIAIGLAKPYYVEAYVPQDNALKSIKYSPETAETFLNEYLIVGGSGFTKGLGETSIIPGAHARTALHFDFAKNKRNGVNLAALEVGFAAEYYTQKIALLANQNESPLFFNFFAALQFGKRY